MIMMIRVDVHPKCEHFGLGLESYRLGLGLTAGLDYIPVTYFYNETRKRYD